MRKISEDNEISRIISILVSILVVSVFFMVALTYMAVSNNTSPAQVEIKLNITDQTPEKGDLIMHTGANDIELFTMKVKDLVDKRWEQRSDNFTYKVQAIIAVTAIFFTVLIVVASLFQYLKTRRFEDEYKELKKELTEKVDSKLIEYQKTLDEQKRTNEKIQNILEKQLDTNKDMQKNLNNQRKENQEIQEDLKKSFKNSIKTMYISDANMLFQEALDMEEYSTDKIIEKCKASIRKLDVLAENSNLEVAFCSDIDEKLELKYARVYKHMGSIYMKSDNLNLAKEYFNLALKKNNNDFKIYQFLGSTKMCEQYRMNSEKAKIELQKEALNYFNKSVALEENNPSIYFSIGEIYEMQKDYSKAIENFDKVIKYSPDEYEYKSDDIKKLKKLKKNNLKIMAFIKKAALLDNMKETRKAKQVLNEVLVLANKQDNKGTITYIEEKLGIKK
jgi:tetratricopeptide (TPR) repeat protein